MAKFKEAILNRKANLNKFIAHPTCAGLYARVGKSETTWYERISSPDRKKVKFGTLYNPDKKTGMQISEATAYVDRLRVNTSDMTEAEREAQSKRSVKTEKLRTLIPKILHVRSGYPERFKTLCTVMPKIMDTEAGKLTVDMVVDWRNAYKSKPVTLSNGKKGGLPKPTTVNQKTSDLSAFLSALVDAKLIHRNVLKNNFKKLPQSSDGRERFLGEFENEEQLFWDAIDQRNDHIKPIVYLLAFTGARFGEINTLRWSEINSVTNTITKQNHKTAWRDHKPKTIHLIPDAREALEEWKSRTNFRPDEIQHNAEYVFFNPTTGKPIGSINGAWKKIIDSIGIPNLTRHDLRRTAATKMAMAGYNVFQIGNLLGDKDPRAIRVYARIAQKQNSAAIEEALSRKKK